MAKLTAEIDSLNGDLEHLTQELKDTNEKIV
jgi:peptidoglycan hydrolase CwlO-like protein